MSFYTSLSGLRGAQTDLATVSNNVANVSTYGFKRSRVQFGDIMPPSPSAPGLGTRVRDIEQQFTAGGYESSARDLDLAITGPGFFVSRPSPGGGQMVYSRNGSMGIDASRFLVDSNNGYVQVLPVDDAGNPTATDAAAASSLQLPLTSGAPRATTLLALSATLPRSAAKPAESTAYSAQRPYAFDPNDRNSFNFSQQTSVIDSNGKPVAATLYFVNAQSTAVGDATDQWDVHAYIGGEPATTAPIALTFGANGVVSAPIGAQPLDPVALPGGAAPLAISLDFGTTTNVNGSLFTVAGVSQDGFAPSEFADFTIAPDGLMKVTFADGSVRNAGKLLLADFASPEGLREIGNARWTQTGASGEPRVGTPGEGGLGEIQAGVLERANVDLTEELVALISAQRNFQANAKALDTANMLTQSILNLRN